MSRAWFPYRRITSYNVCYTKLLRVQVNTGGECHLDAVMLHQALGQIDLNTVDMLLVENVGNLVCPADFRRNNFV